MKTLIQKLRACLRCVLKSRPAKIVIDLALAIIVTLLFRESFTLLKLAQVGTEISLSEGVLGNMLERL